MGLCLIGVLSTQAQDMHFSHIHASPTILNPAMTGLFNGDIRFTANTKSQWNSFTKGYRTMAGTADMKLSVLPGGDIIGGGLQVLSDKAGDLDFTTTSVGFSISYMKALDKRQNFIAFGLNNSYVNNRVDFTKAIAFDNEPLIQNGSDFRVNYWDVSAGVGWFYNINKDYAFHLGVSVFHLNRPFVSFADEATLTDGQHLYRKWVVHGTGDFKISRKSTLKPSFMFNDQGPHREISLGSFWKYRTSKDRRQQTPTSIYFGAWMRWHAVQGFVGKDAIIAALRVDYKNTYMTFTFDINISDLSAVSYGQGGPEFSVIQLVDFRSKRYRPKKLECPAFIY